MKFIEKKEKTIKYLKNIEKKAEKLAERLNEKCDHGWAFGRNNKKTTPNSAIQDGFCYRCGTDIK